MAARKQQIKKTFNPNWFLIGKEDNIFDYEYQSYMALAVQRDSYKEINKCNFDIFIELLFNGLRMNTLYLDKTYVDEYYKNEQNKYVDIIIENINKNSYNGQEFGKIITFFEQIVNSSLFDTITLLYNKLMDVYIYKKDKYIQNLDDLFISIDTGKSISLYKIEYTSDSIYGSHIIKLMEENNGVRQLNRFERFIKEFNEINDIKIEANNFMAIDATKSKLKAINIIKAIRCIHCTNKWFNKKGEFNISLPYELFCTEYKQNSIFKYKF